MGTWIVAGVIGLVYGVAGTIGQAAMWGAVPLGLVIAVIAIAALEVNQQSHAALLMSPWPGA